MLATLCSVVLAAAPPGVLQFHGDARRTGLFVDPAFTRSAAAKLKLDPKFAPTFDGDTYAQPLFVPGRGAVPDLLLVVTEHDEVLAFAATDGRALWRKKLGEPVPRSELPCGNIDPLGITGTPIADAATRTVYLDAMVKGAGHELFALSVDDGSVRAGWPVKLEGLHSGEVEFSSRVQNQRGALAILDGRLYVPFGGHWGDCGEYHGWVVSVGLGQPGAPRAWATRARGGGIWAPGGLATDDGKLFAATGNTFGASSWSDGEAVLRFRPGPSFAGTSADSFAPTDWRTLDQHDTDLGGSGPILLDLPGTRAPHAAIAMGKNGVIYLLDRDDLGGIGHEVASLHVSSAPIINAGAAFPTADGAMVLFKGVIKDCPTARNADLGAVRVRGGPKPSLALAWCAASHGAFPGGGSPLVTSPDGHRDFVVWVVGAGDDQRLRAFDGESGALLFTAADAPKTPVQRFQAPLVARGALYVAANGRLERFVPAR